MMSKLWLAGAAILVMALAVGVVIVALVTGRGGVDLLPADSPEGAVQRYLMALENEDYETAYQYLGGEMQGKCSLDEFIRMNYWQVSRGDSVTLDRTQNFGDRALVTVIVTRFDTEAPFGASEDEYDRTYQLRLESGQWRFAESRGWCGPY